MPSSSPWKMIRCFHSTVRTLTHPHILDPHNSGSQQSRRFGTKPKGGGAASGAGGIGAAIAAWPDLVKKVRLTRP